METLSLSPVPDAPVPAPIPVPAPAPAVPIILQPGVPLTLQLTENGVTIQATITFNVSASGGVSFSVDSNAITADSSSPI